MFWFWLVIRRLSCLTVQNVCVAILFFLCADDARCKDDEIDPQKPGGTSTLLVLLSKCASLSIQFVKGPCFRDSFKRKSFFVFRVFVVDDTFIYLLIYLQCAIPVLTLPAMVSSNIRHLGFSMQFDSIRFNFSIYSFIGEQHEAHCCSILFVARPDSNLLLPKFCASPGIHSIMPGRGSLCEIV